jgi:hypothetical protein
MNTTPSTIQCSTKKELATQYGVTVKTLNKILQPFETTIGIKNGRYYTPLQVSKIYTCLGAPNTIIAD